MEKEVEEWIKKKKQELSKGKSVLSAEPTPVQEKADTKPVKSVEPIKPVGQVEQGTKEAEEETKENKKEVEQPAEQPIGQPAEQPIGQPVEQKRFGQRQPEYKPPVKQTIKSSVSVEDKIGEYLQKGAVEERQIQKDEAQRAQISQTGQIEKQTKTSKFSMPKMLKTRSSFFSKKRILIIIVSSIAGLVAGYLSFMFLIK